MRVFHYTHFGFATELTIINDELSVLDVPNFGNEKFVGNDGLVYKILKHEMEIY